MLGWFIVISIAGGDEPMKVGDVRTLATWRSSIGGVDWIDRLVERRLAKFESGNGYPTRFSTIAAAALPLIANGKPPAHRDFPVYGDDYFMPAGWIGDFTAYVERIASCKPTDSLVIEVWDLS
ncbi:hypothetical protein ACIGHN_24665 [Acidovorax sp. NPDC077693]|uniref:hypothetical protein n=1 Tax=unclassified Acidovorax TaxID=2684926 RepID=UPI0037CA8840